MEKKPTATSAAPGAAAPPVGVCERIFNAFQIHPAFTNIRRLTNRQSGAAALAHEQGPLPVPTAPPMATVPQTGPPTTPSRPNAPVLVPVKSTLGRENNGQVVSDPPEPVKDKVVTATGKKPPAGTDPSSVTKTALEAAPKQAAVVEPNGTGGQPQSGKPRRNINDKVEAYINRTRNRMRVPSHLGGTATTKNDTK